MRRRVGTAQVGLLPLILACGGAEDGSEPAFELPQIVPNSNVLCLSYDPVEVGMRAEHFVLVSNRGRDPLLVESAELEDDLRGSFTMDGLRTERGMDCGGAEPPCELQTAQTAVARFFYEPQAEGWDAVRVRIRSNAQNFPALGVFVLHLALPVGTSTNSYDPGPKPAVAVDASGNETCPEPSGG